MVNIVGRESVSAHDREMAGEVDKHPEQFAARRASRQHADVRVDRTGGFDDIGIPLPRMSGLAAVAHQEPAVEADARLMADAVAQFGGMQRVIRRDDRLGDPFRDQIDVFGISLRLEAGRHRPAAMRVAGADQDVRTRNLGGVGDRFSGSGRGFLADKDASRSRPRRPWFGRSG